mmetsp:Transcript_16614/g.45400  ORF Transcript_16614/g.45400 Transcript_16614/m.45400 type:complete len:227 (-) Transcript_16614:957-1637(-)
MNAVAVVVASACKRVRTKCVASVSKPARLTLALTLIEANPMVGAIHRAPWPWRRPDRGDRHVRVAVGWRLLLFQPEADDRGTVQRHRAIGATPIACAMAAALVAVAPAIAIVGAARMLARVPEPPWVAQALPFHAEAVVAAIPRARPRVAKFTNESIGTNTTSCEFVAYAIVTATQRTRRGQGCRRSVGDRLAVPRHGLRLFDDRWYGWQSARCPIRFGFLHVGDL